MVLEDLLRECVVSAAVQLDGSGEAHLSQPS
jgi:hypothetical protein